MKARRDKARELKSCFNCFIPGHRNTECRSQSSCRICSGSHNTLLHQEASPDTRVGVNYAANGTITTLSMTANVKITGPAGHTLVARALLDSGASQSLVTSRVVQAVQATTEVHRTNFSGVANMPAPTSAKRVHLFVSPLQGPLKKLPITAAVFDMVAGDSPCLPAPEVRKLPHIRGLQLADPKFDMPGRIDILIGVDLLDSILIMESRHGAPGTATAYNTIFGWTVLSHFGESSGNTNICITTQKIEPELEDGDYLLQRLWKQEEVEPPQPAFSPEELLVQEHYSNNLSYNSISCRYTVRLPIRKESPALGDSRTQALQRFRANERGTINKGTYAKFQQVVQEYLDLGHAQPVNTSTIISNQPYYLPMHAVMKHSSTSTKLRVVFDASAKSITGISLNQTLMVGPTIHPTLENILLRFRSYPVALSGDIAKMYREVELDAADRHLHRFLWRPKPEDQISEYEMTRVTFGVAASPHLAIRTLQQTAQDHSTDPVASYHVLQWF